MLCPDVWSQKKSSDWEGLQARKVWGVDFDLVGFTLAIPADKWDHVFHITLNLAGIILSDRPLPLKLTQRFTGSLNWFSEVARPLRPLFRAWYCLVGYADDENAVSTLRLSTADRARLLSDLHTLIVALSDEDMRIRPMRPSGRPPTVEIASDASFHGFCVRVDFPLDDREALVFQDWWTNDESARFAWLHDKRPFNALEDFHICLCEMIPFVMTLLHLEDDHLLLHGDVVLCVSDNSAVVGWLDTLRARNPIALYLLQTVVGVLLRSECDITARHIPGELHHFCDSGSRPDKLQVFQFLLESCGLRLQPLRLGARNLVHHFGRSLTSTLVVSAKTSAADMSLPGNAGRPSPFATTSPRLTASSNVLSQLCDAIGMLMP
jgi:hypothetical protein